MTTDRQLPQFFGRVNSRGTPYVAVITAWLFGPLAYLSLGSGGASQAFSWLLSLSTVAGLIAWAVLSFSYIRFHRALQVQGVDRNTLPWKSPFQPYTAWWGFLGSTIIALVQGFSVFLKGNWSISDFVASYVGIPIFIVPIIVWKLWHKTKVSLPLSLCCGRSWLIQVMQFMRAHEIDLWSGRLRVGEIPARPKSTTAWGKFTDWLV